MCATTNGKADTANGASSSNGTKAEENGQDVPPAKTQPPLLCRAWIGLYNSLPHTAGGFDVSLTLLTIVALTCLRFLSETVQESVFGWPQNEMITKEAAASAVAIFHSCNLVPALFLLFLSYGYSPSQRLDVAPKWYRDCVTALLQFCTGYMVYDGVLNIVLLKWENGLSSADYMFLGHHMATTLYMTSTRVVRAGHMSAMMCMFLGELTNPLHNSYYIADYAQKLDCCNGETSQRMHHIIAMSFSALYVLMRAVVAPVMCLHMSYDLAVRGRKNGIPVALLLVWNFLIWAVILGSIPWVEDCWNMLQKGLFSGDSADTGSEEPISSEL